MEQTEGNVVEQNGAVLRTVADYLTDVATFVNNSNVTINATVSYTLTLLLKIIIVQDNYSLYRLLKV